MRYQSIRLKQIDSKVKCLDTIDRLLSDRHNYLGGGGSYFKVRDNTLLKGAEKTLKLLNKKLDKLKIEETTMQTATTCQTIVKAVAIVDAARANELGDARSMLDEYFPLGDFPLGLLNDENACYKFGWDSETGYFYDEVAA